MLQKFDKFHKTKIGYLLFGCAELVIAYVFMSLAIDKGNLLYYALTLIFFVGALHNFLNFLGLFVHRRARRG